jgi:hypothetical protein
MYKYSTGLYYEMSHFIFKTVCVVAADYSNRCHPFSPPALCTSHVVSLIRLCSEVNLLNLPKLHSLRC